MSLSVFRISFLSFVTSLGKTAEAVELFSSEPELILTYLSMRDLECHSTYSLSVEMVLVCVDHCCMTFETVYVRIAILLWPTMSFWTNTGQMKSVPRLYAKQVQTDGYDIVVVS